MLEFDPNLEALKIALKNLFKRTSFSICTIDDLLKMRQIVPDREAYRIMHAVHCVDYKEMSPDFRQYLFNSVINMFDVDSTEFDFEVIERMQPKRKIFNLLG